MRRKYWLLDYFIRDKKDLAPSYVKKVESFLKCLKKKQEYKRKATAWIKKNPQWDIDALREKSFNEVFHPEKNAKERS